MGKGNTMTSKEIIKRIIAHEQPPRIGYDFLGDNPRDILGAPTAHLIGPEGDRFQAWNRDPSLTARVPGFSGELMLTPMGNIYGRLTETTKGECVNGALQDGWDKLETWTLPAIDETADKKFEAASYKESDKFILGWLPFAVFSVLRDGRHMDNALMDTILEPEYVTVFLDKIMVLAIKILDKAQKNGIEGIMIGDDLGTQNALFFSPETFRTLFKQYYKKLADEIHNRGMFFFLHSCGKIHDIIADFIDAGVDVFQFDQPELSGSAVLAKEFGRKAAFYSPVDIQKIMSTGDKQLIEETALNMVSSFKACGGSLIAKDYPSWQDINVLPEWAQWARDVFTANGELG
jgi:hypothetical protein